MSTGFGVSPCRICGAALVVRVAARHDRDERPGVRVLRVADDGARRALLDDAAEVHDQDAVGVVRGGREVVRDHQDAEPAAPQAVEQVEDARAHRDVEHRDGLVGDEQLRLEHERRRDRDALPLAARELVRVAVEEELGGREPGALERLAHALGALLRVPMRWITSGSATVSRTR